MSEKFTVTPEVLDTLSGFHESEDIHTAYSGRSMYGRTCLGYTGEDLIAFTFRMAVETARAEQDGEDPDLFTVEDYLMMIGEPISDSLGRSTIHYWPNVTVGESE